MNFENPVVASVANIDGDVFVKRNGIEVPLQEDMVLQAGDVLRSTSNSIAVLSIPGTQQQIPAFLEISNGGEATLGFDPDAGLNGQVVITSNAGEGLGNVTLVSEFDGQNQAAVLDGQEANGEMSGLFGAGLLGAGAGFSALPVAGAVGAAALFAGSDDDDSGNGSIPGGNPDPLPAENAGGLAETVSDLTNNLSEITEPVPVIGDVVNTVGNVIESTLVGDNNGGLSGILSGLTDGLTNGLEGTPLAPVGGALETGLSSLTSLLGVAANQISSFGDGTPIEPLADLVGNLLGTTGPNTDGGVGGVVGTLVNVTGNVGQLLEPVPLLGDLAGTLGGVVDSVATGNNDGGLGGILSGLGGGLENGLADTPLALIGEGGNTLLNTVGGLLGGVGDAVSSVGAGTPAEPVTNLIGDLAGSLEGDVGSALSSIPFLGGVLDSLTGGLGGGSLLADVPLLGDVFDGGLLSGGLTSSISSSSGGDGGLLGGLPLLGDLTKTLG